MAELSSLIFDIQKLFKGGNPLSHLDSFKDSLESLTRKRFERVLEKREPKLSLSMIGKPLRQLIYELKGFKGESPNPSDLMKFVYGDICESLILFLAKEAGHKVDFFQAKVELDGVPGRLDCTIDDWLIDVKSCSNAAYKKFENGSLHKDDNLGYIGQLAGYYECMKAKVKGAAFLAINKQTGDLCLYFPDLSNYKPKERIKIIRKAVEQEELPEKCYEDVLLSKKKPDGPRVLGFNCSYCPYRYECWKDSNEGRGLVRHIYSYGTQYFTDLKNHKFRKEIPEDEFPIKED